MTRDLDAAVREIQTYPPANWQEQFEPAASKGRKTRCVTCLRTGWGGYGRPAWWQAKCLLGHPFQCGQCPRVFGSGTGLASHVRRSHS